MPLAGGGAEGRHWEVFETLKTPHSWRRIDDEFTDDPGNFRERHYREFVSFLKGLVASGVRARLQTVVPALTQSRLTRFTD